MTKSAPNDPETFPFLVIGNKVDLEDQRKVSTLEAKKFCEQNGEMAFYECSAMNNYLVEDAFRELGAGALKRQMKDKPDLNAAS